jgi:UDP-N-acetylmuramate dehydrogenase
VNSKELKNERQEQKMKIQELKDIFPQGLFEGEVIFMEPMRSHTSLRIGGSADIFVIPHDLSSLIRILNHLRKNDIPVFPVGSGTNLLVRDGGIEGAVISLKSFRRIGVLKQDTEHVHLAVEAGALLQRLVHYVGENGYSGIEGLAGIPGTVGGAICGNSGAHGYEMKDALISVEILDKAGNVKKVNAKEISFGYRSSDISPDELILDAELKLAVHDREAVSERIENFLRVRRESQPVWEQTAGCVFKNPPGLSAGKLIDEAGCKGMRIGENEVSTLHANFFINKGSGTASDFVRLMEEVILRVKERSGVVLEPEIKIVGRALAHG